MDPTTHGLIALAVIALLCGMRRRRTGVAMTAEEIRDAHLVSEIERWASGK